MDNYLIDGGARLLLYAFIILCINVLIILAVRKIVLWYFMIERRTWALERIAKALEDLAGR